MMKQAFDSSVSQTFWALLQKPPQQKVVIYEV